MATHSSVLSWRIPRTEEPSGVYMGSQRVRHDLKTKSPPPIITVSMLVRVCGSPSPWGYLLLVKAWSGVTGNHGEGTGWVWELC